MKVSLLGVRFGETGSEDAFNRAAALPNKGRLGLANRLSACLQAAPSLLVQQANQGRHLMEVVINNPLANAIDGKHFLPFARGADGKIIEQAKMKLNWRSWRSRTWPTTF